MLAERGKDKQIRSQLKYLKDLFRKSLKVNSSKKYVDKNHSPLFLSKAIIYSTSTDSASCNDTMSEMDETYET